MYVDQWGEIHPTGPTKEKPQFPFTPASIEEIGVDQLSDIGQKVKRYGTAKARNRQMAGFLVQSSTSSTNDPLRRLSRRMYECASWLEFHHYTQDHKTRLAGASLCKNHLLCPVCAIRRGVKTLRNYHERAVYLAGNHAFQLVTLTVKNGPDLWERYSHLKASFKRLRGRAKKGYGALSGVSGMVWSTEFTKSAQGWHPHLHVLVATPSDHPPIRWGEGSQLALDWLAATCDSYIVHAAVIDGAGDSLAASLCEVLKYALKFSDLDLADNFHAWQTLRGKRLVQAAGCFYGLELPDSDDLLDDPLDAPYVSLFFRYGSTGYKLCDTQIASNMHSNTIKVPEWQ